jgi:hypothetical protein
LARAVSLEGVPYDVPLSPEGVPVMIIDGAVSPEQMRSTILS